MQHLPSDSFILANHLEMESEEEDMGIMVRHSVAAPEQPRVLSQVSETDAPLFAGTVESTNGHSMPISIGKTDVGNGKPRPFIHISDDPSIASRHITLTAMQTNDGKFRVMLRQNHPHTKVLLGGSLIRPCIPYPVTDNDEVALGDGVTFRIRLNNSVSCDRQPRRSIGAGPTQPYLPSPDSEASHEAEQRDKEQKRREFKERTTPDDSLLMQIAAAAVADEEMEDETFKQISLVHEVTDTFPYSSRCSNSSVASLLPPIVPNAIQSQTTPVQTTVIDDELIDQLLFDECSPGAPRFTQDNPAIAPVAESEAAIDTTQSPQDKENVDVDESFEEKWRPPQLSQIIDEGKDSSSPPSKESSLLERTKKRMESKRQLEEATNFSTNNTPGRTPSAAGPPPRKMTRRSSAEEVPASLEGSQPKKIVFLRTAVDIDKSTETAVVAVGAKFENKWSNKVEALVTNNIVRTTKFMCAINKGLAIFSKQILQDIKMNKFLPALDDPSLWLSDPAGEAKYEFNLRESIERARKSPLLANIDVYCFKNSIGEFSSDELKDLVTTAGGRVISRLPKDIDEVYPEGAGLIVIGAEGNKSIAKQSGLKFYNKIEFLVDCCIKQTLDYSFGRIDV